MIERQVPERRRHRRASVCWPVMVEAGDQLLEAETANVGSLGAKVRLSVPLEPGTVARLYLRPEDQRPLDVEALVWRVDREGVAFFFLWLCRPASESPEENEATESALVERTAK